LVVTTVGNNRIMVIDIVTINTENITGKDETEKN
jgi:hypothetical protein